MNKPKQPDKPRTVDAVPEIKRGEAPERSAVAGAAVQSVMVAASENKTQDERICAMDTAGYAHYESVVLPGNMMLLRFKKKE